MRYSLFSTLTQLALIAVVVGFSLSPIVLAAVLSGQYAPVGGA